MEAAQAHVPPQNLEAEESVLGALMVSEAAMNPVILDVRLNEEDFYRERHRIIFRAIKRLYERSEPIDALTVASRSNPRISPAGVSQAITLPLSMIAIRSQSTSASSM